ncbi:glycosyltransferase family 2 protein [Variovorax sp. OV329]|uniref:glycosyltransferase family 2 protein n=1 Tax=Variovorax sp. OV329 TaxID=1882825 RepID=UPI0008EEE84A|nr:glycosyltransferase family 2 protein [Variovorax sp. OV329]SFN07924.1 Glycosyltransferase involved in cell wall bisynthesis [Variovorax sp. OV329]
MNGHVDIEHSALLGTGQGRRPPLISVVVPVFNEEEVVGHFHERMSRLLAEIDYPAEIVFVDDGSTDGTLQALHALRESDPRIAVLGLSRNFGKEIALSAGLDHASGDAVVVIDVDLQDPPEIIKEFIAKWEAGYDVVYGQRIVRDGETALKKMTAFLFYRVMRKLTRVNLPEDTGDFRLMSRRVVDALKSCREQHRFMKGLFAWVGYRQCAVRYHRESRVAGTTKFNYWKLWNFALEGITSFTTGPLKVATYVGFMTAAVAFFFLVWIVGKTLLHGDPVRGYPSLMAVVLFLGGIQLVTIGILGEYVGRMFDETKGRPLYLLKDVWPAESADEDLAPDLLEHLGRRPGERQTVDARATSALNERAR